MSPEVLQYCSRAIVRYMNGDMALFNFYVRRAMKIYEKEARLHVPIAELVSKETLDRLRQIN